jgi:hypothetical protein
MHNWQFLQAQLSSNWPIDFNPRIANQGRNSIWAGAGAEEREREREGERYARILSGDRRHQRLSPAAQRTADLQEIVAFPGFRGID